MDDAAVLHGLTGYGKYALSLSLQKGVLFDEDALRIVLDFALSDAEASPEKLEEMDWQLDDEQCDEIQDVVLDYLRDNGLPEQLEAAGMDESAEYINWVHVSVNGKFLFD